MKSVKLLFMDVDGTLTDGKIYMGEQGEIFKAFDIKDGYGIRNILPKYGIIPVIITARKSQIVYNRCIELGITHIYQDCHDKYAKMLDVASQYGIVLRTGTVLEYCAYIGDDIIDLKCIQMCKYSGCPADAVHEVKKKVNYISNYNGGCGAVREFIEWLVD